MGDSSKTKQGQGAEQVGSSMEAQGDRGSLWEKGKLARRLGAHDLAA